VTAASPARAASEEIPVRLVRLWLCDPCLDGAGGECHTPGCALWINRAPDLPLRKSAFVTILGAQDEATAPDSPGRAAYEAFYDATPAGRGLEWDHDQVAQLRPYWDAAAQAAIEAHRELNAVAPVPAGTPRCPRDHVKRGRDIEMDRILAPGGGWSCSGILLDGSDCDYATGAQPAAPELAAAMAETRDVRDGYAALCGEFSDSPQSGQSARISLTVLNRHRERAGLPPRSPAPAGEREDLTMRYRRERDELRAALREAIAHVEPVDQNSELAIARWQELAGQEDPA